MHADLHSATLRLMRREGDELPPSFAAELEVRHRVVLVSERGDLGTRSARDLEYRRASDTGALHRVEVADDALLRHGRSAPVPPDERPCAMSLRAARRRTRDQLVDHVAELRLRSLLDEHGVRTVLRRGPGVGSGHGIDRHRAALQAEVALPSPDRRKHREFVPRGASAALFVPHLHAAHERLRHRTGGDSKPRDGNTRQDIGAKIEVDEIDWHRAFANRPVGRLRIHAQVAFESVRKHPAHLVPRLHLFRDELASGQRRYPVALRLQKPTDVCREANDAERYGSVGRIGKRAPVYIVRVGRGVRRGMAQRLLPRGNHVREDFADSVQLRAEAEANVAAHAHRDIGASVLRVDYLAHSERGRTARRRDDGKYLALARVGQRVQHRKRPDVVVVAAHVGVEDDARGRSGRAERERGERCAERSRQAHIGLPLCPHASQGRTVKVRSL